MSERLGETAPQSSTSKEQEQSGLESLQFEPSKLEEQPGRQNIRVKDKEGHSIGSAELYFKEQPIPHFKMSELYIVPGKDTRGQGYGSQLLEFIQENLHILNRPGLLQDVASTNECNHEAVAGMYERHGWVPVPGRERIFAYNLPEGTDITVFAEH